MHDLVDRLRGTLLPAVVTPMDERGVVDHDALAVYAERIAAGPIGGIAVWAHTGRGLHLSEDDRGRVLATWRQATSAPIVAGVGVPRSATAPTLAAAADATVAMAVRAAELGADAVMVYPLAALGDRADGHAQAVRLHQRVTAESGLPLVGFYLHGEAGGYPYSAELIRDLLALPAMLGVKTATLDSAIGCQDALWAGRGTGKLSITGEDRMFGPSFMWGADTALVGIAAAQVELSARVVQTWNERDHAAFVRASDRLDRFAAATFYAPIEGHVQRMMWAAVWEGLIPERSAHDPYGPSLPNGDRDQVIGCLKELRAAAAA
ncbi:dihydrodipicolinate synthase family protein [Actinomadura rudentiformis]|uniref:Dihydrodipicolinate synthase family protein n=1 Tax=Actinomadura rudentiformis TaxID=359158 RepID=A0A6H9YPV5_9ACTN|nr:dihydrodipicolinate synthase family protein [Actinomadura rudentiformis]KAB2347016.1 dihydrodipicolinate synthase family protein [Actinomadura rudentiformis]